MPNKPVRFLLVDDLKDNLVALEALLRRDGLELHQAQSGPEALELLLRHDFALALLDVQMPEMDGYELAELMRSTERTRKVPIIFVTAAELEEKRRFRGYEAGAVDYIFKPIDPAILKSKAEVFFEIGRQAKELERQRDEMRALSEHLTTALTRLQAHTDNSPLAIVEFCSALNILSWSDGAARMFGYTAAEMVGRSVAGSGWLPDSEAGILRGWLHSPGGGARSIDAQPLRARNRNGQEMDLECYGSILGAGPGTGAAGSLNIQIVDITERRRSEAVRSLLLGELNHRVKNSLANVQAIARQTMRSTTNPAEFNAAFSGRLQALSRAHSLLSDTTWSGADLQEILADQARSGILPTDRLDISGPPVRLAPDDTLRLALTLHELATNAAKYGALRSPEGRVALRWQIEPPAPGAGPGGSDWLHLEWAESGGPKVVPPQRTSFGHSLITASAEPSGGKAEPVWRESGVIWTIRLPLRQLEAGSAPPPCAKDEAPTALSPPTSLPLDGLRLLVIEDEALVALDLVAELEDAGAQIAGQAASVSDALALVARPGLHADLAVLDGNLGGKPVASIAEALRRAQIPFCFVSGYGRAHLPPGFNDAPLVEKPFRADRLIEALAGLRRARVAA